MREGVESDVGVETGGSRNESEGTALLGGRDVVRVRWERPRERPSLHIIRNGMSQGRVTESRLLAELIISGNNGFSLWQALVSMVCFPSLALIPNRIVSYASGNW